MTSHFDLARHAAIPIGAIAACALAGFLSFPSGPADARLPAPAPTILTEARDGVYGGLDQKWFASPVLASLGQEKPYIDDRGMVRPREEVMPADPQSYHTTVETRPSPVVHHRRGPVIERGRGIASPVPIVEQPSLWGRLFGAAPTRPAGDGVAIYNIAARTVTLPDGTRLEAHSGLGPCRDDARCAALRMRGPTPPGVVYQVAARAELFHGVEALHLNPITGDMHGRAGMLAHPCMMGENCDSNGCMSVRNYDAFLHAVKQGQVKRLEVVAGG